MSMDQQLLEELYGDSNPESSDEMIKEAQAELVEAVADEAGIDLNTLDDNELDKFAEYVLTPDNGQQHLDPNLATADAMGRQMAHSYADEQIKIASHLQGDTMIDDILFEKAAQWDMAKEAADKTKLKDRSISLAKAGRGLSRATGYRDIMKARDLGRLMKEYRGGMSGEAFKAERKAFKDNVKLLKGDQRKAYLADNKKFRHAGLKADTGRHSGASLGASGPRGYDIAKRTRKGLYIRGGLKAGATAALTGGALYAGHRMMNKKSSYDPSVAWIEDLEGVEFAKLAEYRAAEILAANGVDPDTFEPCYPEHIKVANFPEPEDAYDYESAEEIADYNEVLDGAALDILDELGFLD